MRIAGLQKVSLLDFPGRIAATVFLPGCNMRCPFCHNALLVLPGENPDPGMTELEFLDFLQTRPGKLDGVCVTGGEPTLHKELPELLRKIKDMGFQIKLDTNGTNPQMLSALMAEGLLDYVAMDIKNTFEKYPVTAGGGGVDVAKVEESIDFLLTDAVDYEFRTTVTAELHTPQDIGVIASRIRGAKRYFLQNFKDSGDIVSGGNTAVTPQIMEEMVKAAQDVVCRVMAR